MKVQFTLMASKVFDLDLQDYPEMTQVEAIESVKEAFLGDLELFLGSRDIEITMEAKVKS